MQNKNEFKIVFIGSYGAGKTNIVSRLVSNKFDENSRATNGASYGQKSLGLEGHIFNANIWDITGAYCYKSMASIFLKDTNGAFAVYDITRKESFDEIDEWIGLLNEVQKNDIPMIIVGTKCDLKDKREVTMKEGELKAKKYGADFIEVSAFSGENIQKAFEILMKKVAKIGEEDFKTKYDKLKEDYDKLNNELNKAKCTIFNIEDKIKKNLNEINNLKKIILQKDDEILNLNLKIKNFESFSKTSFNNDDIISVHFISLDQNINCPIKCLKTETFTEVEERLYQKYQEYRETNNKFLLKGITIMRFKKVIDNNIIDGDKIELIKLD